MTNSEQIELGILGGLLIDNEALPECVSRLVPSDFRNPACRLIFSAMVELYNNNEPVDLITLTSLLKERGEFKEAGGAIFLMELIDAVPVGESIMDWIERLEEGRIQNARD